MVEMGHQCVGKVVETSPEWFRTIVLTEQLQGPFFAFLGRLHPITAQE